MDTLYNIALGITSRVVLYVENFVFMIGKRKFDRCALIER